MNPTKPSREDRAYAAIPLAGATAAFLFGCCLLVFDNAVLQRANGGTGQDYLTGLIVVGETL